MYISHSLSIYIYIYIYISVARPGAGDEGGVVADVARGGKYRHMMIDQTTSRTASVPLAALLLKSPVRRTVLYCTYCTILYYIHHTLYTIHYTLFTIHYITLHYITLHYITLLSYTIVYYTILS